MERITSPFWSIPALLLVLICGFARPANASIVFVNQNATGSVHDGKAWSTAFTSIQPAIDAAKSGDEVWVAAGTYIEQVTVKGGTPLYGGFNGTETDRSRRNWNAYLAIVYGYGRPTDSAVTTNGPESVLDGFTVHPGSDANGVLSSGTSTIINCIISGNSSIGVVSNGSTTITNCTISGNVYGVWNEGSTTIANCAISSTDYGVYANNGTATVTKCDISGSSGVFASGAPGTTVSDCTISGTGMGVYVYSGAPTISNCTIGGNSLYGVYAYGGSVNISNCTIVRNGYGGIGAAYGSAKVTNCVVAQNAWGIDQQQTNPGTMTLSHNDVFGNTKTNYLYTTDRTGTNGNISSDPRFVNQAVGDYHLLSESPCWNAGDDSVVIAGSTDLDGKPRIVGSHVDMGAYEIQPTAPWTALLGTGVTGGVTVAEKVAYVAGNDGNLYARSTEDGSAVAGFPVDISAAVGATVKLPSRPAVYYGRTGKAIYVTTDRGDVVRVLPSGQVAWHVRPLTGQTVSTPAVTPDGNVFVNLSTGSGPFNNFVFELDEATGTPLSLSPFLGYTTADNIGDFSPAANSHYLYVNSGWGSKSGLTLLNQDNLAVRSSFAGGEQCLSPLLLGSDLLLASKSGKAWKMNAVTLAPDLGFGHFGVADLGSQISAAPFSDAAGNVYIGTADGRILKWTPGSGAFTPLYTASGKIAGLTIDRTAGVLGFGTSNGDFAQVPIGNPAGATSASAGGPISTGAVYESLTDRFIIVTDTGVLSGYPAIR